MTLYDFFDDHWFLAFFAMWFVFRLAIRLIRLSAVLVRGWPTPPLDADGDVCHPKAEDDE